MIAISRCRASSFNLEAEHMYALDRYSFMRRSLLYQLRASDEPGAAAVAAILDTCTESKPCRSAACPVCAAAFQQAAVAVVEQHIREPARAIRNRMTALTIVPASGCFAPNDLTVEACERVAAEITTALATLGLPPAVIGFEVSFNEDITGKVEPHWCAHAHTNGLDWLSAAQDAGLRAAFPRSRLVKRPIKYELLDQNPQGRLYPFKAEHVRRVTQLKSDHPEREPYRETKRRELRPWQAVTLALVKHQRGFSGRLLTHGIDAEAVRGQLRGFGWARDGP